MNEIHFPTVETARQIGIDWGAVDREIYAASNGYRHTGYDLYDGSRETPIYSVANGIVEWSGYERAHRYGRHVLLSHNVNGVRFYTRYAHLKESFVFENDIILGGWHIGNMGGELSDPYRGASSGKHLHFELLLPNKPSDRDYIFINWNGLYSVDPIRWLEDTFMDDGIGTVYPKGIRGLNIRSLPSISGQKVGALPHNIKKEFTEKAKDESGNEWVKLRSLRDEWVCVEYRGEELAIVNLYPNDTEQTAPPPTPEWSKADLDDLARRVKRLEEIAGI